MPIDHDPMDTIPDVPFATEWDLRGTDKKGEVVQQPTDLEELERKIRQELGELGMTDEAVST